MRTLITFLLLTLSLFAADGWYKGKWQSADGGGGSLNVRLEPKAEVNFTFEGTTITGTVVESKVNEQTFEMVFDFTMDGSESRATLKGTRSNTTIEGTYRSAPKGGGDADSGTFKLSAAE